MDELEMEPNTAFEVMDRLLYQKSSQHFSDAERQVFLESWAGSTYEEMADKLGYAPGYLSRTIGPGLWESLSTAIGDKVTKPNFKWTVERYMNAEESGQRIGFSNPVQESCEGELMVYSEEFKSYENEENLKPFESTGFNGQKVLCGIRTKNLKAGNFIQKSSQHHAQEILTDAEVEESIIIGNVIQEA